MNYSLYIRTGPAALIAPDSALVDTSGEFIFAVLTKLTTGGFKHLLTVNRAYFRIRHQCQKCGRPIIWAGELRLRAQELECPRIMSTDLDDLRLLAEWHEVSRNLLSYQGLWERMSRASAHGGDRTMLNPTPSYHCVWL